VFVADAIMDLLRPVPMLFRTEDEGISLLHSVFELCERAYDLGSVMLEEGFAVTSPEVGGDAGTAGVKVVGFEGEMQPGEEAGEVLYTVFGGMSMMGGGGKVKVLEKAQVVVGVKKAWAASMEAALVLSEAALRLWEQGVGERVDNTLHL